MNVDQEYFLPFKSLQNIFIGKLYTRYTNVITHLVIIIFLNVFLAHFSHKSQGMCCYVTRVLSQGPGLYEKTRKLIQFFLHDCIGNR